MDHPTPLQMLCAISEEISTMNDERIAEGLDPLPVATMRRIRAAMARACAEHDRKTNRRFAA